LRGGENEVTRVAVASLVQRGLLRVADDGRKGSTKRIARVGDPASGELSPIEACVMKWSGFPAKPSKMFERNGIPSRLTEFCIPYEAELTEQRLLAPPEIKQLALWLWSIGSAMILGVGGYKLAVALTKGHHNVVLLIIIAVIGVIALSVVCLSLPRVS